MQVRRIVLLSLMPRKIPGGVSRWVNDFMKAFHDREVVHFSGHDFLDQGFRIDAQLDEMSLAQFTGEWLVDNRRVNEDDIFIVDGFWGTGIPFSKNVISVCHGTWAKRTKQDLDKGFKPEFPAQTAYQMEYWKKLTDEGGRIISVSEFAQDDLLNTWGMKSGVVNNCIDTDEFVPAQSKMNRKRPIIIHGVNSKVKASDHIEFIKDGIDADIFLLDDAVKHYGIEKYKMLAQADVIVIPSHYEGNSYFTLEALACDVPIICYNVGMPWWAYDHGFMWSAGSILDYKNYNKEMTYQAVRDVLAEDKRNFRPKDLALEFTPKRFRNEWKNEIERLEKELC